MIDAFVVDWFVDLAGSGWKSRDALIMEAARASPLPANGSIEP